MALDAQTPPSTLKFGDLELDPRAYELRRSGQPLKLERIPMELLLLLVEQRGQLVTREQIVQRIWGKSVFVDTDNSINAAIRKVRLALADDPEQPRFIQTVTGKGYRFIASTEVTEAPIQTIFDQPQSMPATAATEEKSRPLEKSLWRWLAAVILALLLAAALGAYLRFARGSPPPQPVGEQRMLAVLPFENLTGDASQDYFTDGLTEELIAQLGRLDPRQLGVIARTSVMQYKLKPKPLDQIARELGVQYVLEGSVRRDAGKVRITAQLIQTKNQSHLWARQYDREVSNLLTLQGEIAQEVAREIQLTLGEPARAAPAFPRSASPRSPEAYELYLEGRYFWNRRTLQGLQQAIQYFQQAIDKDPTYARAYAGLAQCYALMSGYDHAPPSESMQKARAAARRALEIDEQLPEAHTALAVIAQDYDWDWPTAEKEYRRAIQLDPNYATGHQWYAECLALQGRFDEAFPEIDRARQLDPLSLIIATDRGVIFYFSRQYDRAIEQFRSVLDMEPAFPRAHMVIFAYAQVGNYDEAVAAAEKWRRTENSWWSWIMLAYLRGRLGQRAPAQQALNQFERLRRGKEIDPVLPLVAQIGMGDKEKALLSLEEAYRERSSSLTAIRVDPIYDPLRSEPRFQAVLHQLNLAP